MYKRKLFVHPSISPPFVCPTPQPPKFSSRKKRETVTSGVMDSSKKIWRQKAKEGRGHGKRRSDSVSPPFFGRKRNKLLSFFLWERGGVALFLLQELSGLGGFFLKGWWETFLGKF